MWYVGPQAIVPVLYPLVVCMFLFTTLALIVVTIRFYTRTFIIRRLGWDDWFMMFSMSFSICFFVAVFFQIKYGLGKPESIDTIDNFLAAIYSTVAIYNFTQMLYKLSLAFQAHRIFKTDPTRSIINVLIGWLILCGIMTVCGALFYCTPVSKSWNDDIEGHCGDRSAMVYSWAGFNLLNDVAILVLPIPYLVRLQLDHKARVVLLSLFACGFFTTIISIIRLKSLYDSMSQPQTEQPVTGVNIALWSCIEINLAIITGSVPSIRPFVGRFVTGQAYNATRDYGNPISGFGNTRKQSLVLFSGTDIEPITCPASAKLKIQVQQSIEMNTVEAGDSESQRGLVLSGGLASAGHNVTKIHGGLSMYSDTYSQV